jgi:Zn-dependent alcohol dehydrogenase
MLENHEGGCHCGRVRFRARFDQINEGLALMLAGEVARGVVAFD